MERYKKPPLERDFQYFLKVGLPSVGVNPHRLKVNRNVANENSSRFSGRLLFDLVFAT